MGWSLTGLSALEAFVVFVALATLVVFAFLAFGFEVEGASTSESFASEANSEVAASASESDSSCLRLEAAAFLGGMFPKV